MIEQSVTFTRTNTVDSADHSKIIKAGTWKADGPAAWGVFTPDQVKVILQIQPKFLLWQ